MKRLLKTPIVFLPIIIIIIVGLFFWSSSTSIVKNQNFLQKFVVRENSEQNWSNPTHSSKQPNVFPIANLKNQNFFTGYLRSEDGKQIQIFLLDRFNDQVSRHVFESRSWEYHIIQPLLKYMTADPELQFIDIGTHLGVYALYVAKLGRKVIAVDADRNNLLRLAQSIKVNGMSEKITLVNNIIEAEQRSFKLGDHLVQSITADDLLKVIPFKRAVLKVNFENQKASMFKKTAKFFENLDIPLVIFSRATMLYCAEYIYEFMNSRGYTAFPNVDSTAPLRGHYKFWPIDLVWKKATKANPLGINDLTKIPNSRIIKYTNPVIVESFDKYTLKTERGPLVLYGHDPRDMITEEIFRSGTWEAHLMAAIGKILKTDPNQGFIDIGSNVGVYTLLASKLGNKVVAVDANIQNVVRVMKSLTENGIKDKVDLIWNAVDSTYTKVKLNILPEHVGASYVVSIDKGDKTAEGLRKTIQIDTITLDDLLKVTTFKKAVMKIDIERKEYDGFRNASKLFNAIDISHVFMEWGSYKDPRSTKKANFIIEFFKKHNYVACKESHPHQPLQGHYTAWSWDIVWIKNKSPKKLPKT